jgi:isopentenyl diphosphate isomerase/L-lactate dehydrogenase-like FMN-dependent dehydrogenase
MVLQIMQRELTLVMGNCGCASVADINRNYLMTTPQWEGINIATMTPAQRT